MNDNTLKIISLYNGKRSAAEVAGIVGLSPRYVRKVAIRHGLDRLPRGSRNGRENHQFVCGQRIDHCGYAIVSAPEGHPHARYRPSRKIGIILKHHLLMEEVLGRYLYPGEVVDHIDGLTLHNDPSNLRLFDRNSDHLAETLRGRVPKWSDEGMASMRIKTDRRKDYPRIDNYRQRKARGEIRLRQILLAALKLGIDSPHLLGTHRHLEKAGIDFSSHSTIKRALDDLYLKWGWPQTQ